MIDRRAFHRLWAEKAAGRGKFLVRGRQGKSCNGEECMIDVKVELEKLKKKIQSCTSCQLSKGRTNTVPGEGSYSPDLVFVGEAPGRDEDLSGRPFVGRSGQLLTRMIMAMGLTREQVFIGNILKCRPPRNRDPLPEEIACCKKYLSKQLQLLKPKIVMPLGAYAARWLLSENVSITRIRGHVIKKEHFIIIPTFHPSYLLRRPEEKAKAWYDLQLVMKMLGLKVPTN